MQNRLLSTLFTLVLALAVPACQENAQNNLQDATEAQGKALEARLEGDSADAVKAQAEATQEAEQAVEQVTGRDSELQPITPGDTTQRP